MSLTRGATSARSTDRIFPFRFETLQRSRFVTFDGDWRPRLVPTRKTPLFWFIQRRKVAADANVEAVLSECTWMMVPDSFPRQWAIRLINYATFVVLLLVCIITLVIVMGVFG